MWDISLAADPCLDRNACMRLLRNEYGDFCLYIYVTADCKTQLWTVELEDFTPLSELELSDHNQLCWQRQISEDKLKGTLEATSPLQ